MAAVESKENNKNPGSGHQPATRVGTDRSTGEAAPVGIPPRLQRDLLLLLRECPAASHWRPETYDTARLHVTQSGRRCHEFLEQQFLGRGLAMALAGVRLVEVLKLTARSDPQGALRLARGVKEWIDLGLLAYDMVEDKQKFYDLLTPEKAAAVTQMFRARRAIAELIALEEGVGVEGDGI
jgi:hypothetical protein